MLNWAGGGNDQVVNIVAAGVGGRFMVRAADKAHHPAAAVDAELGRVGTVTLTLLPLVNVDIAHIGHRHRHAVRGGVGVTRLGGFDFQVVNIVAARVCGRFMVRAADKADHPAATSGVATAV